MGEQLYTVAQLAALRRQGCPECGRPVVVDETPIDDVNLPGMRFMAVVRCGNFRCVKGPKVE